MKVNPTERGFTFLELILSIGLLALVFAAVYASYSSILDSLANAEMRTLATSVLNRQIEIIRNMPYEDVGLLGGAPAGIIPPEQNVQVGAVNFTVETVIRNIDDPYDGTVDGDPADTAPADYKLVEVTVRCPPPQCFRFMPLTTTARVSPKALESETEEGSLFITVLNASGLPVENTTVHVANASVTPAIDLTDTTDNLGILKLIGIPTSTERYAIDVGKAGYSREQTYLPGEPANPNPVKPHATVLPKTVTRVSFAIDRTSSVTVESKDLFCTPIGNVDFTMDGTKLIGINPDILKFSTSSETGAQGTHPFLNIEWDSYNLPMTEAAYDVEGTIPLEPLAVNPAGSYTFGFVLTPTDANSLLVTVKDATTGAPLSGATVTLSLGASSETERTGRRELAHTDWSGNQYANQSGGIEADAFPGELRLRLEGGVYPTSTTHTLESLSFDVGGENSTFFTLSWAPASQPALTTLQFQLASNNDNSTWNFTGPDGTSLTYYTVSGSAIHASMNNKRYLRYKVFMQTQDENATPRVEDAKVEFYGPCVPLAQVVFQNLALGDYTLTVTAQGYEDSSRVVSVVGPWQQEEVLMVPL
jgi:type II secretory pathway pseudopilin PulG